MKNIISYLFFSCLFASIFVSCNKELEVPDQYFPLIVMEDVEVSSQNVTFKAQLVNNGKSDIKEFGFIYSKEGEFYFRIPCGTGKPPKIFEYKATLGIYKGASYWVRAYLETTTDSVFSDEKIFSPKNTPIEMELTDFEPKTGNINQEIIISGKNLDPSFALRAYIGDFEAEIIENTATSIKIRVPNTRKVYSEKIKLVNRYDSIASASPFNVRFAWVQKKDFNFQSLAPRDCLFSFGLKNKGYLYFAGKSNLITYNPIKDEWTNDGPTLPYNPGRNPSAIYVGDNEVYVLLHDRLYSYSEERGWAFLFNVTAVKEEYKRSLSYMNNKLYVIVTNPRNVIEIQEYNMYSKSLTYIEIPTYPRILQNTAFFAHQNKLYLLSMVDYADSFEAFFEYNFESWMRKKDSHIEEMDFSESAYVSYFKHNNLFYVGLGYSSGWGAGYGSHQYWRYDPQKSEWKRMDDCLQSAYAVTTFLIENKAYMLSSGNGHRNTSWMFEFDTTQN